MHFSGFLKLFSTANLVWNRAVCVSTDSIDFISLPLGYEQVYAVFTSQIVAHLREKGLIGKMQKLSGTQNDQLARLTNRAANWDVSHDIPPSLFPTRDVIPGPLPLLTSHLAMKTETFNSSLELSDAATQKASLKRDISAKIVTINYCSSLPGSWFKRPFEKTSDKKLEHRDQHCCANACASFMVLTRMSSGSRGLDTCCRECNAYKCGGGMGVRTLMATVSIIASPTKLDSNPAVFMFVV